MLCTCGGMCSFRLWLAGLVAVIWEVFPICKIRKMDLSASYCVFRLGFPVTFPSEKKVKAEWSWPWKLVKETFRTQHDLYPSVRAGERWMRT